MWAVKATSGGAVTLQATGYYIPYTPGDNGTRAAGVALPTTRMIGQCGLSDGSAAGQWRMPNRKEMESLADRMQTNEADCFNAAWTSADTGLNSLGAVFTAKSQSGYTLAVR